MKKLVNVIFVSAVALVMFACNSDKKSDLVGVWNVDSVDFSEMLKGLDEEELEMYEAFLPMMEESMKSMTLTLAEDGIMTVQSNAMGQEMKEQGTWSLSDDGKELTTTSDSGEDTVMLIQEVTSSSMKVNLESAEGLVYKMTFVKS